MTAEADKEIQALSRTQHMLFHFNYHDKREQLRDKFAKELNDMLSRYEREMCTIPTNMWGYCHKCEMLAKEIGAA